jgi:hypothetical protein
MDRKSFKLVSGTKEGKDEKNDDKLKELMNKVDEVYFSVSEKKKIVAENRGKNLDIESSYIIIPSSRLKISWDLFLGVVIFIQSWFIPIDFGYNKECFMTENAQSVVLYVTVITYAFFGIDIFLTFITALENEKGDLVYDYKTIALNYIQGFFFLDIAGNLPFEYMISFQVSDCWTNSVSLNKVMLIFRFLRLFRLLRVNEIVEKYKPQKLTSFIRLFKIILFYFFIIHLIGVLFTSNSLTLLAQIPDNIKNTKNASDFFTIYGYSLYVGIFLVLGNDIAYKSSAEKFMIIIINILALITNANIFGYIAVTLNSSDLGGDDSTVERLEEIKDFLLYQEISGSLPNDIKEYYELMHKRQMNLFFQNDLFEGLCDSLKLQSKFQYWKNSYFQYDTLFINCNSEFVNDSILVLKAKMVCQNERIIHEGESTMDFYLITDGGEFAVSVHGVRIKILNKGGYFGETAVFMSSEKRTASVDSLVLTDLLYINGIDFINLLRNHHEEQAKLKSIAMANFFNTVGLTRVNLASQLFPSNQTEPLFKNTLYDDGITNIKKYLIIIYTDLFEMRKHL